MKIPLTMQRAASWYAGAAYHAGYEGAAALALGALHAKWRSKTFASSGLLILGGMRFAFGVGWVRSGRTQVFEDDWLRDWKHDGHGRLIRIALEQLECHSVAEVEQTDLAHRLWLTVGEAT